MAVRSGANAASAHHTPENAHLQRHFTDGSQGGAVSASGVMPHRQLSVDSSDPGSAHGSRMRAADSTALQLVGATEAISGESTSHYPSSQSMPAAGARTLESPTPGGGGGELAASQQSHGGSSRTPTGGSEAGPGNSADNDSSSGNA